MDNHCIITAGAAAMKRSTPSHFETATAESITASVNTDGKGIGYLVANTYLALIEDANGMVIKKTAKGLHRLATHVMLYHDIGQALSITLIVFKVKHAQFTLAIPGDVVLDHKQKLQANGEIVAFANAIGQYKSTKNKNRISMEEAMEILGRVMCSTG